MLEDNPATGDQAPTHFLKHQLSDQLLRAYDLLQSIPQCHAFDTVYLPSYNRIITTIAQAVFILSMFNKPWESKYRSNVIHGRCGAESSVFVFSGPLHLERLDLQIEHQVSTVSSGPAALEKHYEIDCWQSRQCRPGESGGRRRFAIILAGVPSA